MMRIVNMVAIALAGLGFASITYAEDKPAEKAESKQPRYSIVRTWVPEVGQNAHLVNTQGSSIYVAIDPNSWRQLGAALRARDKTGVEQMIKENAVASVPNLTPILLLKDYEHFRPDRFTPYTTTSWQARITGGDYKGKVAIVSSDFVHKVVDLNSESSKKSSKTFQADRTANKASNAFRAARKLETEGNTQAAINSYKRVAKEYPDSPEARMATSRVKALAK